MLTSEILVEPGDMPSGATTAFANVTTWAESMEAARDKVAKYLESFNWHLLSVEKCQQISDDNEYSEEVADMIRRTRANPDAVILGRFYSYKES